MEGLSDTTTLVLRGIAPVVARADGDPLDADLRVTLHFHPHHVRDGLTVLAALARDNVYRVCSRRRVPSVT